MVDGVDYTTDGSYRDFRTKGISFYLAAQPMKYCAQGADKSPIKKLPYSIVNMHAFEAACRCNIQAGESESSAAWNWVYNFGFFAAALAVTTSVSLLGLALSTATLAISSAIAQNGADAESLAALNDNQRAALFWLPIAGGVVAGGGGILSGAITAAYGFFQPDASRALYLEQEANYTAMRSRLLVLAKQRRTKTTEEEVNQLLEKCEKEPKRVVAGNVAALFGE